jgi:hypothetical protein
LEVKWNLLNVDGAAHTDEKECFLAELALFCSRNKEPYVVAGDFNIIRYSFEKNKNYHFSRFSSMFNNLS